ncbi:MAG: CaiB/BaiF CoA transferase family protein [Smithellaceae bacterium]
MPLSPYRILDLTEGGYNFAGKILADLGAEVIRIEPPEGSQTRKRTPLWCDAKGKKESLLWVSYNVNKYGITLNLESEEGREILRELVKVSHAVIESSTPGFMEKMHLDYGNLKKVNPSIIVTSITPYGQRGQYRSRKATDLTIWSMSGMHNLCGQDDRAPVRLSVVPQAELLAGAQGAAGTMLALYHSANTGEGQHVDVSAQFSSAWVTMNALGFPILHNMEPKREGQFRRYGFVTWRHIYECKDGHVAFFVRGGPTFGRSVHATIKWMKEEGYDTIELEKVNWLKLDMGALVCLGEEKARETLRRVEDPIQQFFLTKTKAELYKRALKDDILLVPCYDSKDIIEDEHLSGREFWWKTNVPDHAGVSIKVPGPWARMSGTPLRIHRGAPSIGEHNGEIYSRTIGLTKNQIKQLMGKSVI